MTTKLESDALKKEVRKFALHLNKVISEVFPGNHLKFKTLIGTKLRGDFSRNISILLKPPLHSKRLPVIELRTKNDSKLVPYIRASFKCKWSNDGKYLAIQKSTFELYLKGDSANPLIRYEYEQKRNMNLPNAHIHVHAHRDEIVWLKSGKTSRNSNRPLLSDIHFPVGGDRFRPCFEDFLSLVIEEFGIKTKTGYRKVLNDGRVQWRQTQLKAAVRDNPLDAIEALDAMGLWGTEIQSINASKRINKLEKI